ncbi:MAG: PAS domain S-box protein [Planctomycetota bacterium]
MKRHGKTISFQVITRDVTNRKRAENQLGQSEEFLANMINALDDPVFVKDEQHRWTILNDAACKVMGRSREELIGKSDYDLFSKQQADVFWARDEFVLKSGQTDINEEEITWHGKLHTISTKKSLFIDSVTGKKFVVGTIRDITERKKAEEMLSYERDLIRTLLENHPDFIYFKDNKARFRHVSSCFCDLFGCSKEDIVGKTDLDLFPEEVAKQTFNEDLHVIETETPLINKEESASGTSVLTTKMPWFDKEGNIIGLFGISRDITERKKAEEKLRQSEQRFRSIFDNANDMIGFVNTAGKIIEVNKKVTDILGYEPDELVGKNFMKCGILQIKNAPTIIRLFKEFIKRRELPDIEGDDCNVTQLALRHKKGHTVFIEASTTAIKTDGKLKGFLSVIRDITERKQTEEALRLERDNFTNILDSMEDGVYIVDQNYDVQYVNPALKKDFGPCQGRKCYEYFHDRMEVCPWCKNKEVVAGKTVRWEWYSAKNQRTYDLVDTPLRNHDGSMSKLEIFRDITERKQTEEELRKSRDSLAEAQRIAHLGSWEWDIKKNKLSWSEEIHRIFGVKQGEFTEDFDGFFRYVHPDDKNLVEEIVEQAISTGKNIDFEHRIVLPNGTGRVVYERGVTIYDESGNAVKLAGICYDITERKQAEEALKTSELRFRSLIEQTTDAVFCYEYDPPIPTDLPIVEQVKLLYDAVLVECNDVCARAYGARRAQEVIGRTLTELFATTPGSLDKLFTALIQGGYHIVDGQGAEKLEDGTQRYYLNNGHGVIEDGKLIRVWGTFRDITERKQAEEALRASEERYRAIFEQAADAIVLVDAETGELLEFNDRTYENLGYTREEFRKLKIPDFEVIESAEEVAKHIEKIITEGADTFETKHMTKDGEIRDVQVSSRAISIREKDFVQSIWCDITERRRTEEAMQSSEAKYRSLIANIPDVVWTSDEKGNTAFISSNIEDIYGYSPEEIYSEGDRLWFGRIHPDDLEKVKESYRAVFGRGEQLDVEYRIRRKDGEWIWIRDRSIGAYEKDGVKYADGVFIDITERKKAEEALRGSEERLSLIYNTTTDIMSLLEAEPNGEFNVVTVNDRIMDYLAEAGITKDMICNTNVRKFFQEVLRLKPEDIAYRFARLREVANSKRTVRYEVVTPLPTGATITCETTINPIVNERRQCTHLLAVIKDITERKQAQQSLEESESRFRELVENIHEVFWMENSDGTELLYVSPTYEQIWGRSCEEFYKNPKVWIEAIHPDDRQRVAEAFSRFPETGVYSEEFRIVRPDGTIRWVWDRGVLIHNECGEVARVAGIAEDITQRKQAEDALKESEKRFRNLSEAAFEGIAFTEKGVLVDANEAFTKIFGYSLEESKGKQVVELVAPEHRELVTENIRSGYEGIYEHKGLHKDGSLIDLEVHGLSVTYQGREMRLTAIRDITERKQADQKLLEDQVKLKSLASELSLAEERERRRIATELHDRIGQSLVISKMNLEALRKSEYGKKTDETLGEICNSLAQTIADTRTLTFDLSSPILYELGFEVAVAEWLAEEIRDKHGIAIQFEDDGRPKPLDDDIRILLFRDVRELLINVVKHARTDKVKVSIRRVGNKIYVTIEDNGVGFDPAKTASSAAKRAEFGLFSIRQRLEQLGGHLEIESEPGRGCTVTMTAPLKQE